MQEVHVAAFGCDVVAKDPRAFHMDTCMYMCNSSFDALTI